MQINSSYYNWFKKIISIFIGILWLIFLFSEQIENGSLAEYPVSFPIFNIISAILLVVFFYLIGLGFRFIIKKFKK